MPCRDLLARHSPSPDQDPSLASENLFGSIDSFKGTTHKLLIIRGTQARGLLKILDVETRGLDWTREGSYQGRV